jgi:hypothetical protein
MLHVAIVVALAEFPLWTCLLGLKCGCWVNMDLEQMSLTKC